MRKKGVLYLWIVILGPCLVAMGCAGGIAGLSGGANAARKTVASKASDPKVVKSVKSSPTAKKKKSTAASSSSVAKKTPGSETRLSLDEVAQLIRAAKEKPQASSPEARLVAHETPVPEPPPAELEKTPLPTEPPQTPASAPEIVPPPRAEPTEKPSKEPVGDKSKSEPESPKKLPDAGPGEKAATSLPAAESARGEPLITLHVDNLEVGKVIEMVSRQAKMVNILVTPAVRGTVTLDIRDKTVDETLDLIARFCRLSVHRENDVIYVSTLSEALDREADNMPVRVYRLNYVKSKDVVDMITPLLSKKGSISQSPESEVGYPATTVSATGGGGVRAGAKAGGNSMAGCEYVVVQDYSHVLARIDRVVAEIDVQPAQVLIEAVVVSVRLTDEMDLGINYAVLDGAGNALGLVGDGTLINAAAGFTPAGVLASSAANNVKQVIQSGDVNSNQITTTTGSTGKVLGAYADADHGIKFGLSSKSVTGFIKALQERGETKVLACPRILVLNKQGAMVHLGDNLGYYTTQVTQTSTTQTANFMPIGTQLQLRPFISSDGMIRMEVHPERSTGFLESGLPQTNAAEVTTNVMVPNGTTIVIGGLIDTQVERTDNGIPLLMELPVIGGLFRETEKTTTRRELVVILTPYIWRPETPSALNQLGCPRSLGLADRVAAPPRQTAKRGPTLFELTTEDGCPVEGECPVEDGPSDK